MKQFWSATLVTLAVFSRAAAFCSKDQFTCNSGSCIPYSSLCDGKPDHAFETDEILCSDNPFCGRPAIPPVLESRKRVVGGTMAKKGSWPWQVSLQFGTSHLCGGSLIHPLWVLSAAHCFEGTYLGDSAYWMAVLGEHNLTERDLHEQVIGIEKIIKHDKFNGDVKGGNDIALLKLARPAKLTDDVSTVCLPTDLEPSPGFYYVTGFGDVKNTSYRNVLKQAKVSLVDKSTCNRPGYHKGEILDDMMCAGYDLGGIDACRGDSGGPLVRKNGTRWVQYGIVSWGNGCGEPQQPGVYVELPDYVSWVQQTVACHA